MATGKRSDSITDAPAGSLPSSLAISKSGLKSQFSKRTFSSCGKEPNEATDVDVDGDGNDVIHLAKDNTGGTVHAEEEKRQETRHTVDKGEEMTHLRF